MENFFWAIFLQALEIFTLVVGIVGVGLSTLLLLSPRLFNRIGDALSRSIQVDKKISRHVDRSIPTAAFFYRHNIIFGVCLIVGAVFVLLYLFFRLDVDGLVSVFFDNDKFKVTYEILITTMALMGKVAGSAGLLIGLILVSRPEKLQQIERRMDTWFTTQPMWERLDRSRPSVDTLVYRRPIIFGAIGLFTSVVLTFIAVNNLIHL
jgi:heme O synthase-like polyprenyltransferase